MAGLLDFLTADPQTMNTGFQGLMANPSFMAGLGLLGAAQGRPGEGRPTFGQGINGMLAGANAASDYQTNMLKMQFLKQQMEDEQRRRDAIYGKLQANPWTNPDNPQAGPQTGGMIDSLPPEQKQLATIAPDAFVNAKMAQAFPKPLDPTNDMQNYALAVQQGYKGSFMQYKAELAQSMRPQTNVNVATSLPPLEGEYDKALGKANAEAYITLNKDSSSAGDLITKYQQLGTLLNDPGVYTGAGGESVLKLKKVASALGIDVEGLGATQAANAISNSLALELRNPANGAGMPGSLSNSDRDYLKSMVAGISNTREGNQMLLDANVKLARRKQDIAKLARTYTKENGGRFDQAGFADYAQKWADAHPLFPAQSAAPGNFSAPAGAVQALQSNPSLADQFDAKYGQGASRYFLGGH